jgi:hypothetical protein
MPCGFFEEGRLCRCAAVRGLLTPSVYEREKFCLTDDSSRCPTFRARALRDEALPEEVYYALWLPLEEERDPQCAAQEIVPLASVSKPPALGADVYRSFTAR